MYHFGAPLMAFLPVSRTKRNLFKIASLGLAGLLAGLLAGCTDFPEISSTTPYTHVSSETLTPEAPTAGETARLPESLDATQIPPLHHTPSTRSLQQGSARAVSYPLTPSGRNGY
jgi:hypothetical protein